MIRHLKRLTHRKSRATKSRHHLARRRALGRNIERLEQRQMLAADLEFSTFFPSTAQEDGVAAIAQDAAGNAYVADYSYDADTFAFEASVSKLSPSGDLLWRQSLDEYVYDIAVDDTGLVYLAAVTSQDGLAVTADAQQMDLAGGSDFYVMVLDGNAIDADPASLSSEELVYASYLGGSGSEDTTFLKLATDSAGGFYLAGETTSADFPVTTQPGVDSSLGGSSDGVVVSFGRDTAGDYSLNLSTYLGGTAADRIQGLAVDSSGTIHVVGRTSSEDFPLTPNAIQTTNPGSGTAGFVTRLSPSGDITYSTLLGGDVVFDVAVDASGSSFVVGSGGREGFPVTPGAYAPDEILGGDGAIRLRGNFVSKIDGSGELEDSSWFQLSDDVPRIALPMISMDEDRAVISGYDTTGPERSSFFIRFAANFTGLLDYTVVDGEAGNWPWIVSSSVIDGSYLVAGYTDSANFETTADALHPTKNAGTDGFVRRYTFNDLLPPLVFSQSITIEPDIVAGSAFAAIEAQASSPEHTLSYAITAGDPFGAFSINPATGKVSIDDPNAVDFSNYQPTVLTITVTDDQSPPQSNSATLTVRPYEPVRLAEDLFRFRDFESGEGWIESEWQTSNDTYIVDGYDNYGGVLLMNKNGLLQRSLDTSSHETLKLSYWTKLDSLERGDRGLVQVSSDGANWQTIRTHNDGEDDNTWRFEEIEFDTPGDRTYIRFDAEMSRSGRWWRPNNDYWYVDEIMVDGINLANRAPQTNTDVYSVEENGTLTVGGEGVLANDADPDGDAITAALAIAPSHGSFSLASDGSFVYTPDVNFSGTDTFTYLATDGELASAATLVTINVIAVPDNDPPNVVDDSYNTNEDESLTIAAPGVLGNDSDPEGEPITASLVAGPNHGTLTLNADGSFIYTPAADFNGTDQFTYVANDGTSNSSPATVTISVAAVNDAPVAEDQAVSVKENTLKVITLSASDVEGDPLTYIIQTGPNDGTLSGTAPNLNYTPNPGFTGTDSFTFLANDGSEDSNLATVTITVAANQVPVADSQSVSLDEDTSLAFTLSGSDPDGDTITYEVVGIPDNGTLTGTAPDLTYTPAPNFNGSDSFTFKVNDGTDDSAVATVAITVDPVNDAPVADSQSVGTDEDTSVPITLSGSDIDGDTLSYVIVSGPANGSLSGSGANRTYTPDSDFNGSDSFTFKVNDGTVDSAVATVNIDVTAVNDAPVAVADSYVVDQDTSLSVSANGVLANDSDVDGDALTAVPWSGSSNQGGQVVLNSDGSFTYTPPAGFTGVDTFSYSASDGELTSNLATVSIEVQANNEDAMYVYDIRFESRYWGWQRRAVFEVRWDSNGDGQGGSADARLAGVSITVEFAGQTYTGTTDSNGIFRTNWIWNPGSGTDAEVVDMALADYSWDPLALDLEDDSDGDGLPDARL